MNGSFISMSARKEFYIGWHEGVKQPLLHLSPRMVMLHLPVGARFWQLSIHLQMNGITDRVLSLFQCFRKVQVLNVSFDIWLNSFFCLTYTCYEQGFWYFARSRTREIQVFPRNPAKSPKKREIPRNPPEIFPSTCRQNIFNNLSRLLDRFYSPQTSKFSLKLRHCNE